MHARWVRGLARDQDDSFRFVGQGGLREAWSDRCSDASQEQDRGLNGFLHGGEGLENEERDLGSGEDFSKISVS